MNTMFKRKKSLTLEEAEEIINCAGQICDKGQEWFTRFIICILAEVKA